MDALTVFIATPSALGAPAVVLVTLIACIVLLGVRAWAGVVGVALTRRVMALVNASIVVLLVVLAVVIVIRFKTYA
jgi:hypothetical protein